jgi:hypothetical protein
MKTTLISTTLTLVMLGGLATGALEAKGPKRSPAREAAVQRCGQEYEAAAAAAHAPNGPKGNARKHAMHAAAEAKKHCLGKAPR